MRISPADWRLLAAASLLQMITACALRILPLPAMRRLFSGARPMIALGLRGPEERVIWAIEATGHRLRGLSTCLVRALIVEQRFTTPDRPLRLMIGVRRAMVGSLQSHAWVVDRQRILIGGATAGEFTPLVGWDSVRS